MSLAALANHMASKGRNGDSMLVHMSPSEVQALQALAKRNGTSLTINPETGQPEAFSLDSVLPALAGAALDFAVPGLGEAAGLGLSNAATAGLLVGGTSALATGDISRGLMAGLGAYGGAGLTEGLMGAGTGALSSQAGGEALRSAGLTGEAALTPEADQIAQEAISKKLQESSALDKLSTGASAATASGKAALDFAKSNFKPLAAAALPSLLESQTVTKMPTMAQTPSYIRQKKFNPYTQQYVSLAPVEASQWGSRSFSDYANGGVVALADGGYTDAQIQSAIDASRAQGYTDAQIQQGAQANFGLDVGRFFNAPTAGLPAITTQQKVDPTQIPWAQETAAQQAADISIQNNQQQGAINAVTMGANAGLTADQIANSINQTYGKNFGAQNIIDFAAANGITLPAAKVAPPVTTPTTYAPTGTTTPYGNVVTPGDVTRNTDGTQTVTPNIPGRPYGGFTGIQQLKDAYTAGGGSLGQQNLFVPKTIDELYQRYGNTGGSQQAYNYLMGKGAVDIRKPVTPTGELMLPYAQSVMGQPLPTAAKSTQKYIFNPTTKSYVLNPNYVDPNAPVAKTDTTASQTQTKTLDPFSQGSTAKAAGGVAHMALGGIGALAAGGQAGYNLGGYSDGGRLLRGPGDGVSDSIPATIGDKQPARLADGEFVVPARIVSELGNGSTEAGARKLYAMMDRVQRARGKTTGKGKVASDTGADKYLPA